MRHPRRPGRKQNKRTHAPKPRRAVILPSKTYTRSRTYRGPVSGTVVDWVDGKVRVRDVGVSMMHLAPTPKALRERVEKIIEKGPMETWQTT